MAGPFDYDVVIIGSGFGGSINACRLTEAGLKVLVLERGRWWKPPVGTTVDTSQFPADATPYPREPTDPWLWSSEDPANCNGWIEFHFWPGTPNPLAGMAVATAAGVGGGSLVYANVSAIPPENIFSEGWPTAITYAELQPFYDTAGKVLNVQELPDNQLTRRYQLVQEGANAIGDGNRFGKLPLAVTFSDKWNYDLPNPFSNSNTHQWTNEFGHVQGTCVHCGNCDVGCQVLAKNTLDLNYLWHAQQLGATVQALTMVSHVAPVEGGGYEVFFSTIDTGTSSISGTGSVKAPRVILAAGSLGSTEILLRSRDEFGTLPNVSAKLGDQWSSNGDYLTPSEYWTRNPPPSPTWGPTITCHIDYLTDQPAGAPQYTIEDGGIPPVLRNALVEALALEEQKIDNNLKMRVQVKFVLKQLLDIVDKRFTEVENEIDGDNELSFLMPWFANGRDAGNGVLKLKDDNKELFLDWDVTQSIPTFQAEILKQVQLAQATGGMAHVPLSWSLFHWLITPHPIGGCPMADTIEAGVVDDRGRVFNYPGLYVSDGSIIPVPIGINPSRTIAALSERIAEFIAAEALLQEMEPGLQSVPVPAIFPPAGAAVTGAVEVVDAAPDA